MDRLVVIIKKDDLKISYGRHDDSYHIDMKDYSMDSIVDIFLNYNNELVANQKETHYWMYHTQIRDLYIFRESIKNVDSIKFTYYSIKEQRDIKIEKLLY